MENRKIDFGSIEWQCPLPGARFKAVQQGTRRLRLIEFGQEFEEPDWCTQGHIGYVIEGEMDIDFDGTIVRYSEGDGLMIPSGEHTRHKATIITEVVKLVLVEDAEQVVAADVLPV